MFTKKKSTNPILVSLLMLLLLSSCFGGGGSSDNTTPQTVTVDETSSGDTQKTPAQPVQSPATTCEPVVQVETVVQECAAPPVSDVTFSGLTSIDQITNSSLRLNWSADAAAKGYVVYSKESDELKFHSFVQESANELTINGLQANTTYEYVVRAVDEKFVQDSNSVALSATTTDLPPDQLLDLISNTSVAFSLRKLTNNYSGPCISVRRDSDNLVADIGFDGYDLDLTALQQHLQGANGYITKWYDQSGAGHHAEQSVAAHQPKIVLAATNGGRASIEFDGNDDHLHNPSVSYDAHQTYIYFEMKNASQKKTQLAQIWGSYPDKVHVAPDPRSPTVISFDGASGGSTTGDFAFDGANFSGSLASNPSSTGWSYDVEHTLVVEYNSARSLTQHTFGSLYPSFAVGAHQFAGEVSEVIVFADKKSAQEKQTIESSLETYY